MLWIGLYASYQQLFWNLNVLWKESISIDSNQFHQCQQIKQIIQQKKPTTYVVDNPGPSLRQAQYFVGIKPVIGTAMQI